MSSIRRIFHGSAANFLNLAYSAIVLVLTVPILTHAWGVDGYGRWIILITIPTYIALSDFGLSTAATNDIAMMTARGDRPGAISTYESMLAFNLIVCAMCASLAFAGLAAAYVAHLKSMTPELYAVLPILVIYSCICMLSRVPLSAFRATGMYAKGTLVYDAIQFLENCAMLFIAATGHGFLACSIALITFRTALTLILFAQMHRDIPWLRFGLRHASFKRIKELAPAAIGSMSIPLSLSLSMQGVAMVVGFAISPTATAILSSTRTVSRFAIQILSTVNRATVPELSAASAKGDAETVRKILILNSTLYFSIVIPAAIGFALLGGWFISVWTHGSMHPGPIFMAFMAGAMALHAIWFFGANMLMATNMHGRLAPVLLMAPTVAVVLTAPVGRAFGLEGVAAVVALSEAVCAFWFFRVAASKGLKIPLPWPLAAQGLKR